MRNRNNRNPDMRWTERARILATVKTITSGVVASSHDGIINVRTTSRYRINRMVEAKLLKKHNANAKPILNDTRERQAEVLRIQ